MSLATSQTRTPLILGIGELLWDLFPDGARFGGAPTNFACSVAGLALDQARVVMATAVGKDDLGRQAIETLKTRGIDLACVEVRDEATGQVLVTLDPQGSASYRFNDNAAWDNLSWNRSLEQIAHEADLICFGTLGQRANASQQTILRLLREVQGSTIKVLDINLRAPHWTRQTIVDSLPLANVLKLNDHELPVLAEIFGLQGSPKQQLVELLNRYRLQLIALTRGAEGSVLINARGEESDRVGTPVRVVDTVGAGDAFTAALALGLLNQFTLQSMHEWAEQVASYVCTQPGATPVIPHALRLKL